MTFARRLLPALIVSLLAAGGTVAQAQQIAWHAGDLANAKRVAEQSGRLLLVHFSTESCAPCQRLEKTVFRQPSVALAINQRFVPVRIDADQHPETAKELNVTRWPTDVILTSDGTVLAKLVSPSTPMDYIAKMTQIANHYNAKLGSDFAKAAVSSPYGAVVNKAYADLARLKEESAAAQSAAAQSAETKPFASAAASGTKTPAVAATPPVKSLPAKAKLPPAQVTNPYIAQVAAAQDKSPPVAVADITPITPIPPVAKAKPEQPSGPSIAVASPQPSSNPSLGFEGYCPVTMKNNWQWKKGDPQFGVIHRGQTYLFAGAAEKDAFFKNPDDYAPVLSGVDPVVALEQGRATPGKRQFAIQYPEQEGPFYLFSSEETLKKFSANPERYAPGVRQAMAGVQPTLLR